MKTEPLTRPALIAAVRTETGQYLTDPDDDRLASIITEHKLIDRKGPMHDGRRLTIGESFTLLTGRRLTL